MTLAKCATIARETVMMNKQYIVAERERYYKILAELETYIGEMDTSTIPRLSLRNKFMNVSEELRSCTREPPKDYIDGLKEIEQFCEQEQETCNPAKHLNDVSYYSGICCEAEYVKSKIKEIRNKRKG